MRKTTSLAITAAILISFSGCRSGNVGMDTRRNYGTDNTPNQSRLVGMDDGNSGINNDAINYGRTSGIGGNDNAAGNFRDGVYTNFGNGHSNGNERVTVVIRNGRIVSIDLASVSQQEANNSRYSSRTGLYNTPGTGTAAGMDAGTNNNLTGFGTGTNNNNGTITGTTGISTDTNNITNTGNGTGIGPNTGTTTGTGSNTNYNTDNINGTALNQAKTNLIAAMIQTQSDNVLEDNNDVTIGNTIDNWKLAVSRALYQARR